MVIPFMISGIILLILTIWFFISVSHIEKDEVTGLSFLQLYAITALLVLVLSIIPSILIYVRKGDYKYFDIIKNFTVIAPYLFLSIFFSKSSTNEGNSRTD
jgi:hypothetical protein